MTNEEKWLRYNDDLPSPETFIKWSYRSLVGAALGRRVWFPPRHSPVFANSYTYLTGPPGVGKNGPITRVNNMVRRFLKKDIKASDGMTDEDKAKFEKLVKDDMKAEMMRIMESKSTSSHVDSPLAIPLAPNAVTYQALLLAMSRAVVRKDVLEFSVTEQKEKMSVKTSNCLYFTLPEIASLFRKHQDELCNFLLEAYDCNEEYEYETISRQKDRLRNLCLNILGGTTPTFIESTFSSRLLGDGFTSRGWFVFANKNRKSIAIRQDQTEEQQKLYLELLHHVRGLISLYGEVQLEPDTRAKFQAWFEDFEKDKKNRASSSPKMDAYYARMNIHAMKAAMQIHFGETKDMVMPWSTLERGINELRYIEKDMHYALVMQGNNPLAVSAGKILELLSKSDMTFLMIHARTFEQIRKHELEEILIYLSETNQIEVMSKRDEAADKDVIWYGYNRKNGN